jgi:voltage-gated potassium channel
VLGYLRNYNFFVLLAGLLLFLVLTAIVQSFAMGSVRLFILWSLCLTLLVQVWSMIEDSQLFKLGILLTIASFLLTGINQFYQFEVLKLVSLFIFIIFFSLVLVIAAREVFSRNTITLNTFVGAFCLYLLLGMIWSILYMFIYQLQPTSFKGLDELIDNGELEFIYFSYITLSSLGYGDIVALTPIARALAYLEVLVGQFYMAILVGALVGKYIANREK